MEAATSAGPPVACTLDAGEFKERLDWIAELNRTALLGAQREGLRLILTYRRNHAERVREAVRRERQCCGFLGFDLREEDDSVTLVIEAPERAADALDAIFAPFLTASLENGGCARGHIRRMGDNDGC